MKSRGVQADASERYLTESRVRCGLLQKLKKANTFPLWGCPNGWSTFRIFSEKGSYRAGSENEEEVSAGLTVKVIREE